MCICVCACVSPRRACVRAWGTRLLAYAVPSFFFNEQKKTKTKRNVHTHHLIFPIQVFDLHVSEWPSDAIGRRLA